MTAPTVADSLRIGERVGHEASPDLVQRRAAGARMRAAEPPSGVTMTDTEYGGVPCRAFTVTQPSATVLYLHGGGYRQGSPVGYTTFSGRLAARANVDIVVPDYRLAPEHPFPAALHDVARVYDVLVVPDGRPPFVAGDSAGGGLAAALVETVVAAQAPAPPAVVLISAWLDIRCGSPIFAANSPTDALFPLAAGRQAAELYLQGHSPEDPLVSPVLGVAPGFPPTLVYASTTETLLGDALAFTQRLAEVGTRVSLEVLANAAHSFHAVAPDGPESAAALERIAAFLSTHATPT